MTTKTKLPIQLGDPIEHCGIVVAPLFPRSDPRAQYLTLDQAVALGFTVTEVDAAGSVPELLAHNPLDASVLLYDGEELIGAKQNRILNITVLVAAASETRIPVSCGEEGRWRARSRHFAPSAHAAYPELRRRKALRLSPAPLERGIAQGEVWHKVAAKSARMRVDSPTRAQADIFEQHGDLLAALKDPFPLAPEQAGALFALDERRCLDYVSRPTAFAHLYPKLLHGYLAARDRTARRRAGARARALPRRDRAGAARATRVRGARRRRPDRGRLSPLPPSSFARANRVELWDRDKLIKALLQVAPA